MHVEKYNKSALGNMLKHYSRDHKNPECRDNINTDLTKNNYNLAPEREITDYQFIQQRLGEVKHLNRDDVNIMADWVITLPKDFNGDEEKFFQYAYKGMCSRYGEENVVSAWVHKDEPQAQPHMHYCFMPIEHTVDKKGQEIEKLNAKAVINRQELREIHPYMENYLERNHVHAHLLNGATREGNKSVKELKQEQAVKDLKAVELYRSVRDDLVEPVKPTLSLRGAVVPYSQYRHDIDTLNAKIMQRENALMAKDREMKELEKQKDRAVKDEIFRYNQLNKDMEREHEEYLKLHDKLNDKDYLKERVRELEREEHTHGHWHNRNDMAINGR